MAPREAALLLDVAVDDAPDVIRAACRRLMKLDHPDHGGTGERLDALKQARDVLLDHTRGVKADPSCRVCQGRGWVSSGWRVADCPRCG